jgi:acyl-CoA synthetase (AMP-forming)/AMP-acid ligase II
MVEKGIRMTVAVSARTVLDRLHEYAERQPSSPAFRLLGGDGRITRTLPYAELSQTTRAIAAGLRSRLPPGERVLLLLPDNLEFVPAFLGCLQADVIAVPAYPPLPTQSRRRIETLRAIAGDCQPAAVLTAAPESVAAEVRCLVPELNDAWWASTADVAASEPGSEASFPVDPANIAFLQYTSGSTSTPKGVMVTHEALAHNEELIHIQMDSHVGVRLVSWLPLFHDMGLIGSVLHPLWMGGSTLLMSASTFIMRPAAWLRAISEYRAYGSGGPNFAYDMCNRRVRDEDCVGLDLSSWKVAFNGSEPIRADTLRAFAKRFMPYGLDPKALSPCYGMAEATLMVTGCRAGRKPVELTVDRDALAHGQAVPSSAGQTLVSSGTAGLDRTVRIVDPVTMRQVADNKVGEIWVGGPFRPTGYWRNAAASEAAFQDRPVRGPNEPHLRTGDLGFLNEGELFVTGRLKDVVIVGGRNHYPQDIEHTVENADPAIRPGCVVAFSYEDFTADAEKVVVVAGTKGAVTQGEAAAVKRAKIIRSIQVAVARDHGITLSDVVVAGASAIPKTSSGKLQRAACRAIYLDGGYAMPDEVEGQPA